MMAKGFDKYVYDESIETESCEMFSRCVIKYSSLLNKKLNN